MTRKTRVSRVTGGLGAFVLSNQVAALVGLFVLISVLMSGLVRVGFDVSPESFFLEGSKTVEDWYVFKDKYQSDEFSFVVVTPPSVTAQTVDTLRDLTDTLSDIDGVERVTSLANVRSIDADGDFIDVGDYLHDDLTEAQLLERIAAAPNHPYYQGLFVNERGTKFGLLVETEGTFSNEDKAGFTSTIREVLQGDAFAEWDGIAIGAPIIDADVQRIVTMESAIFGTVTYLLIMVGLYIAFRHRLAMVLPTVVSCLAIGTAVGAMGLWGADAGLLTPIVPSFLISVGLGTAVYLLTDFTAARRRGVETRTAIIEAMERAGGPALLATVTTAGALFAFSGSRVLAVRDVGLTLGIGLVMACLITLILFPILANLWGERIAPRADRRSDNALLRRLADLSLTYPGLIVGVFAIVLVIAATGVMKLKTDYFYLGTFKTSAPLYIDNAEANGAIPVSNSIEVVISLGELDAFKDPAALRALDTLTADALAAVDEDVPVKAYTLADIVKEISQQMLGSYTIPDTRASVAQMILLFESSGHDELTRVSNPDFSEARLTVLVPSRPYSAYYPLVDHIRDEAGTVFAAAGYPDAEVSVTGVVPMWMQISTFLTETQISSFMISAVVVAGVMIFIAQSVVIGLLMAAINISCVSLVLGFMGHAGIVLDPFTILIGAIALGILDDDTIHFARSYLDRRLNGEAMDVAIHGTFQSAGRAMGLQTMVLVVAFLVYMTGSLQSLATFGLITSLTILLGLIVEYTVTPAMLVLFSRGRAAFDANSPLPDADPDLYRPVLENKSFAPATPK
ncbi:MAG: MMPL family transporter [Pseudomonadota bacterium]